MARKLITAALVLTAALTAAGCGSAADAGAAAHRVDRDAETRAIQYQNEARGPISDGAYSADEEGRVAGFHRRDGDVTEAGRDLARGARDAAKNVSDMAEEAIDGAVDAAKGRAASGGAARGR